MILDKEETSEYEDDIDSTETKLKAYEKLVFILNERWGIYDDNASAIIEELEKLENMLFAINEIYNQGLIEDYNNIDEVIDKLKKYKEMSEKSNEISDYESEIDDYVNAAKQMCKVFKKHHINIEEEK